MALLSSLFSDYGERPLKLVLKVSGNEVTTGSSSRDTFYDEQSAELDKPKEKKKKKKKDKERNLGSPSDDRGKKKVMPVFSLLPKQENVEKVSQRYCLCLDDKEEERAGCRWGR